ncbi:MAG: UbiD family decarboxylase domain-containing protein, partial [Planctomycetota bacterium]
MSFADLPSFLAELEQRGWLRRVRVEVDPVLEITEIADQVVKSGGPALLFERVRDPRTGALSPFPLLINTFGTRERMCLALGCGDFDEIAARVKALLKPEIPTTLLQKLKKLPELAQLGSLPPKIVKRGACQDVVHTDDADLFTLPALKCWPEDGGRYITLGAVITKHPETGDRNIGMYRVQLFEPRLAAMHWHMHHDGARHFRAYKARAEQAGRTGSVSDVRAG